MKKFLKNYEFTLTVKGPVHIGDGKTLTKVDYFFYKDRIYFPNLHKMFTYINQMHLTSDYESFMYSANNNLTYWLMIRELFLQWQRNVQTIAFL